MVYTTRNLSQFYSTYKEMLFKNAYFRKQIMSQKKYLKFKKEDKSKNVFNNIFDLLIEEAELTLQLLEDQQIKGKDLLEIGSGMGLVYGYLKKNGFNIYGIEPSDSGYDGSFIAAKQMFKIIKIDDTNYYPYSAKKSNKIHKKFDIIFSNNVLEHIPELEESFFIMSTMLKKKGLMIHNTVNYYIPYEPHFKIPLIPFFPKKTEVLKQDLKKQNMWLGLNFLTTSKLKYYCQLNKLKIKFKKDRLRKTLARLEYDLEFAKRQRYFLSIYKLLKAFKLLPYLDLIPIFMTTPVTFEAWRE